MHETMIGTRICSDELGFPHTFCYWLITQHIPAGHFTLENYGVKVEEEGGESACFYSITYSRTRIDTLLALLMEHAVTPVNLFEVMEDWTEKNRLPYQPQQAVTM